MAHRLLFGPEAVVPTTQGWIYVSTIVIVSMAIGVDFNRNVTIFILAVIGGLWGLNYYFESARNTLLLGGVVNYFASFKPIVSLDAMLMVSNFLLILYIIMLIVVRFNDRWRITQNEIEHICLGMQDDAIARAGKRVKARYTDVLEAILLLSGTIVVLSTTGKEVIREIKNVPFLILRMRKIDRILESQSMTVDQIAAIAEEEER